MKKLLSPFWFTIIQVLPLSLLTFLLFSQHSVIASTAREYQNSLWTKFSFISLAITCMSIALNVYLFKIKRNLHWGFALIFMIINITYSIVFLEYEAHLFSWKVPNWFYFSNFLNIFACIIFPTVLYNLMALMISATKEDEQQSAWPNFVGAIIIPVVGYLLAQVMLPLAQQIGIQYFEHVALIFTIIGFLLFIFMLIRGVYVYYLKFKRKSTHIIIFRVLFCIVFPIIGLVLNSGVDWSFSSDRVGGILGDFNNIWFLIIAAANGALLCIPQIKTLKYRLFLYILRSVTFIFSLYFFIVLLPYTPISFPLLFLFGIGILILTPIFLFVIHIRVLVQDFTFLKEIIHPNKLVITMIVSFMVIPSSITINFLYDKSVLHEALEFAFRPNFDKAYNIDKDALRRALQEVNIHQKDERSKWLFINSTPFISMYYNWLVLDNLSLSRSKIHTLKKVFFEPEMEDFDDVANVPRLNDSPIHLTDTRIESQYDEKTGFWRSWVHFELTNTSAGQLQEFESQFVLPDGCWISDYYLNIEGRIEYGILAEKKSALWIYSNIVNQNRDPGILNYLTGNKIQFRVFPFKSHEVRETGIQFLHAEPVVLTFENQQINLGDDSRKKSSLATTNMIYVSKTDKQKLPLVSRTPYFHFIVDASRGKSYKTKLYITNIEKLISEYPKLAPKAKISFVNTYTKTYKLNDNWQQAYKNQSFEGGFYLDKAIKETFYKSLDQPEFPVIVVLTDNLYTALIHNDFAEFQFIFPEQKYFYQLNDDCTLKAHDLLQDSQFAVVDSCVIDNYPKVRRYVSKDNSIHYLPDDQNPSVILKNHSNHELVTKIEEKNWLTALELEGLRRYHILHPNAYDDTWITLVKSSFQAHIMTPATSFISLETETQKAALQHKQQEILEGHELLDADNQVVMMSEPDLWVLALFVLLIIGFHYLKNKRNILKEN